MGNQSKCANELHEKTFPKTKTRVFRDGQWYTHTLMTDDIVNIPNKPYGYSPNDRNVLWSCHYNLKPGATICTNGGEYKCRYIYVQRENVLRRELRPVYDPTDAFNINKAKREAKCTVPTVPTVRSLLLGSRKLLARQRQHQKVLTRSCWKGKLQFWEIELVLMRTN